MRRITVAPAQDAVNGFAAELSDAQVAALREDARVTAIEQDRVVTADATQTNATWGLDRIDQRNLPLSTTYTYNSTGAGVYAYVIDTGIHTAHANFGGHDRQRHLRRRPRPCGCAACACSTARAPARPRASSRR